MLLTDPVKVLAVTLVIMVGKTLAAIALVLLMRLPLNTALTVGVSLAQIGEFSFILAGLGVGLNLLPREGQNLILAGAMLSIACNSLLFAAITRWSSACARATAGRASWPCGLIPCPSCPARCIASR